MTEARPLIRRPEGKVRRLRVAIAIGNNGNGVGRGGGESNWIKRTIITRKQIFKHEDETVDGRTGNNTIEHGTCKGLLLLKGDK